MALPSDKRTVVAFPRRHVPAQQVILAIVRSTPIPPAPEVSPETRPARRFAGPDTIPLKQTLDSYRRQIQCAGTERSEEVCSRIAERLEDELARCPQMPSAHVAFFADLLSVPALFATAGVWNFLLVLGTQRHTLLLTDFRRLGLCVAQCYGHYEDEDLCLAVCDFIARHFLWEDAASLLMRLKMMEACKAERLQGMADDGLRILAARRSHGSRGPFSPPSSPHNSG